LLAGGGGKVFLARIFHQTPAAPRICTSFSQISLTIS
jgi:hypothetical protein